MHNLKTNFDKFSEQLKNNLSDILLPDDNFKPYLRKPKLNDIAILALTLCAESMSIDAENYFWSKLITDHLQDFPSLIHRCNFNRRKKNLSPYLTEYNTRLANLMNEGETVYIVDSMPIPVANIAREKRSTICKEHFEAAPDKGYSAITRSYFYDYKLRLVCSVRGVVNSMQLSKASVHDLHYLQEVKHTKLNNCLLLGDKGYLSAEIKTDLFNSANTQTK
jgi:Transposase DDE domain